MHHSFVDVLKNEDYKFRKQPILLPVKQIKKQNVIIIGYIRRNNTQIIYCHDHIAKLILLYTRFYCNPYIDPVNRISNKDLLNSDYYRLKGNELFKNKQYKDSIVKYNTAIHFNPNDHRIYCNRSLCNLLLHKLNASREDAYHAIRLCPTNAKCWYRLGIISEQINELTTAYLSYRTANNIFEILTSSDAELINPYKQKFAAMKTQIDSYQHRNDKLWIQYFDKYSLKEAFRLKFNYCLKISNLSRNQFLAKDNWKFYMAIFTELFRLIQQSNTIKYIINRSPIIDIPTQGNFNWCVSYSTSGRIEKNKRIFVLDIVCIETGMIESMNNIYGLPNAKQVISQILRTMIHPCLYSHPYRPVYILIANRLKNEFTEIMSVMMCYGIQCSLETRQQAIESSAKHNTDVDGFNYIKNLEDSIEQRQYCSNSKCITTRNALWKKYKAKFRMCSGCKNAFYCSRKCQKYDWKYVHRDWCRFAIK
eukprot:27772_1